MPRNAEVQPAMGGRGYRVRYSTFPEQGPWGEIGITFSAKADAEKVAHLAAKACRAERMRIEAERARLAAQT